EAPETGIGNDLRVQKERRLGRKVLAVCSVQQGRLGAVACRQGIGEFLFRHGKSIKEQAAITRGGGNDQRHVLGQRCDLRVRGLRGNVRTPDDGCKRLRADRGLRRENLCPGQVLNSI